LDVIEVEKNKKKLLSKPSQGLKTDTFLVQPQFNRGWSVSITFNKLGSRKLFGVRLIKPE